ncbi:unnamed protein product [Rhizopus stolonifer]
MSQTILSVIYTMPKQHVYLKHACHVCKKLYLNSTNLRRHYIDVEVASRFYNTPKVSFISKEQSKRFTNYTITYACNCCQTYYEELNDLADHMIQQHVPKEHPANTASFESLNDKEKWKLSTRDLSKARISPVLTASNILLYFFVLVQKSC